MLWMLVLGLGCLAAAVGYAVWGGVEVVLLRRAQDAPARLEGTVCGFVHHCPLLRYECHGDVPPGAYQNWGRTTADAAHGLGDMLRSLSAWTWYPCVRFWLDGQEKTWISVDGGKVQTWRIGQRVHILYDPARPAKYVLEGDTAMLHTIRGDFVRAAIFAFAGIVLLILYWI